MSDTFHHLVRNLQSGRSSRRTFVTRSLSLGVSLAGIQAVLQACGGNQAGATGGNGGGNIKWSTWAGAQSAKRFQAFTDQYNASHKANVKFTPITSYDDYTPKILSELNAGLAPDVFYASDEFIIKFIQNQTVTELTPLLSGANSLAKVDDYLPGLWGAAKTHSGKIYGIPVDCNPLVLWYNKAVLQQAGIKTMPADLFASGQWTRDAFQQMLDQIHAIKKFGYILDNDLPLQYYSWINNNGGMAYDNDGYGNFVAHQNQPAIDTFKWLQTNIQAKKIVYAGTLNANTQGDDTLFEGNQLGFLSAGRWSLPDYRGTKGLQYDIVPYPSTTGKPEPTGVFLAYIVMNKKTKDQASAYDFLSNYVSKDGEIARLQSVGNGVPSVKGADQVVLAGNDPVHAQYLIDARDRGFATYPVEMGTPGLSGDIMSALENIWVKNADLESTLNTIGSMVNERIKPTQSLLQ